MNQMEEFSFEAKKPERINPENLLLARNFVQLYRAEQETRIRHVSETEDGKEGNTTLAQETERTGKDFSDWLDTGLGAAILEKYAGAHSEEEITQFEEMDRLIEEYEAYRRGTIH